MRKKNKIFTTFFVMIILIIVVFIILYLVKKPVEWKPENSLRLVSKHRISDQLDKESLIRSIDYSLKYLNQKDPALMVNFGKDRYSIRDIIDSLVDFKMKLNEMGLSRIFFQYVKDNFLFYKSGAKRVLFTGYYEARLQGSFKQSNVYRYPIYKKPDDLYRIDLSQFYFFEKKKGLPRIIRGRLTEGNVILPYYDREEIDFQKKLAGRTLEIVWVDDLIDLFFLQIQGSGVIELDSGELIRIHYEESNGQPYRAIGRLLIKRKIITYEELSMQKIRDYLKENPEEIREILTHNPSYIFFKIVKEGPIGAIQLPLTPFRSMATDRYLFPLGALCYIETELPVFNGRKKPKKWKKFRGFVLNQDVGGAIRTPKKVDLFMGQGEKSELIAGHMKQKGTFYFLIKRSAKIK